MSLFSESLWDWSSPVWLTVFALAALYGLALRSDTIRACWFGTGIVALIFAFVSPLGVLADGYLFSAHMLQHLLLLLVVPLCLMLSLPERSSRVEWLNQTRFAPLLRVLAIPTVGWLCGLGIMWFWHVPSLCSAATENSLLGLLRSSTFLLAGMAFWWPIYAPIHAARLAAPTAIVYLFSACLGCTLLGIYITFTTISVCPAFANPVDRIGILTMLYDAGFTPAVDQQLAGLLMWVPPCTLYVGAIISLLCRWYSEDHAAAPISGVTTLTRTSKP